MTPIPPSTQLGASSHLHRSPDTPFLDPTRVGMPDIDVDFEQQRRSEVLAHLVDLYGSDHVARIGTFQMSKTKASIKHAARVLGRPARTGDELASLVPMDGAAPFTFDQMDRTRTTSASEFWEVVDGDERMGDVVELARQFEDVTTGVSIHACGVVVADEPLDDLVPMRRDSSDSGDQTAPMITEWDADGVEGLGLLKLDVLGLRNLDIVSTAVAGVYDLTGEVIDPEHLPDGDQRDDPRVAATWQLLSDGHTAGVFQLESAGMTELAQDVSPSTLDHLSALVALYRPGPMGADMHLRYAARKNGREPVDYSIFTTDTAEQAVIAQVLDDTSGLTVYQEQMMRLGDVVAGFGPSERNRLRKAVSRKNADEVAAVGELFITGATSDQDADGVPKQVFSPATARKVWDTIQGGADYAFNRSHSAAYGQLAYVTAFLKANWPSAYSAALLAHTDNPDKRKVALSALSQEGVTVLPPQVNSSRFQSTAIEHDTVVLGLGEVRDVGKAARAIIDERDRGGRFVSMGDVMDRVVMDAGEDRQSRLTTKTAQALIECGAADEFGPRKGQMRSLWAVRADRSVGCLDEEWGLVEQAVRQHGRLGVIIGRHPMSVLTPQVRQWSPPVRDEDGRALGRRPVSIGRALTSGHEVITTVGLVTSWKVKPDNRGGRRGFMRLEGSKDAFDAVVWNDALSGLERAGGAGVGSIVGVRARVRTREIEQVSDDGEVTVVESRSVSVSRMWPVPYEDVDGHTADRDGGVDLSPVMFSPAARLAQPQPDRSDGPAPVVEREPAVDDATDVSGYQKPNELFEDVGEAARPQVIAPGDMWIPQLGVRGNPVLPPEFFDFHDHYRVFQWTVDPEVVLVSAPDNATWSESQGLQVARAALASDGWVTEPNQMTWWVWHER